jgi:hypothetical protein
MTKARTCAECGKSLSRRAKGNLCRNHSSARTLREMWGDPRRRAAMLAHRSGIRAEVSEERRREIAEKCRQSALARWGTATLTEDERREYTALRRHGCDRNEVFRAIGRADLARE